MSSQGSKQSHRKYNLKAKLVVGHFDIDSGGKRENCVSDKDKQTINQGVLHHSCSSL